MGVYVDVDETNHFLPAIYCLTQRKVELIMPNNYMYAN